MDESYHFNSSCILGHDVVKALPPPTAFEKMVANMGIHGCQKDHSNFSTVVNGLFWYEPATFPAVYKVLRSNIFGMSDAEAKGMMRKCFCEENDGNNGAHKTLTIARESYRRFLEPLDYVTESNKELSLMGKSSMERYLSRNRRAMAQFKV